MLLVPRAGAPVQRGYQIGLLRSQMRSEHLGKQVMIAIPLALVIQWHNKEVAALQRFEEYLGFGIGDWGLGVRGSIPSSQSPVPNQRITQRAMQPVENRSLE